MLEKFLFPMLLRQFLIKSCLQGRLLKSRKPRISPQQSPLRKQRLTPWTCPHGDKKLWPSFHEDTRTTSKNTGRQSRFLIVSIRTLGKFWACPSIRDIGGARMGTKNCASLWARTLTAWPVVYRKSPKSYFSDHLNLPLPETLKFHRNPFIFINFLSSMCSLLRKPEITLYNDNRTCLDLVLPQESVKLYKHVCACCDFQLLVAKSAVRKNGKCLTCAKATTIICCTDITYQYSSMLFMCPFSQN